jgi:hypothetical protein
MSYGEPVRLFVVKQRASVRVEACRRQAMTERVVLWRGFSWLSRAGSCVSTADWIL